MPRALSKGFCVAACLSRVGLPLMVSGEENASTLLSNPLVFAVCDKEDSSFKIYDGNHFINAFFADKPPNSHSVIILESYNVQIEKKVGFTVFVETFKLFPKKQTNPDYLQISHLRNIDYSFQDIIHNDIDYGVEEELTLNDTLIQEHYQELLDSLPGWNPNLSEAENEKEERNERKEERKSVTFQQTTNNVVISNAEMFDKLIEKYNHRKRYLAVREEANESKRNKPDLLDDISFIADLSVQSHGEDENNAIDIAVRALYATEKSEEQKSEQREDLNTFENWAVMFGTDKTRNQNNSEIEKEQPNYFLPFDMLGLEKESQGSLVDTIRFLTQ